MVEKMNRITEDSIKTLVDNFYIKVRQDTELGSIFNEAIGYSDEEWQPHLEKLYAFWSSIMLASRRYHGNPMKKHIVMTVILTVIIIDCLLLINDMIETDKIGSFFFLTMALLVNFDLDKKKKTVE